MTETLSDLLRHSAEAVSAPSVDVAALVAHAGKRQRRRRITLALAAAAVVGAVTAGSLAVRGGSGGDLEPAPSPSPSPSPSLAVDPIGTRPLVYAEGSTVHMGDDTFDAGGTVVFLDATDNGVVFMTGCPWPRPACEEDTDGEWSSDTLWFYDGSTTEAIGRAPTEHIGLFEVTTSNPGSIVVWADATSRKDVWVRRFVVYDTSRREVVARVPYTGHYNTVLRVEAGQVFFNPDSNAPGCWVIDTRFCDDPHLLRYDLSTGTSERIRQTALEDVLSTRSRLVRLAEDRGETGTAFSARQMVRFNQVGRRLQPVDSNGDPTTFVLTTGEKVELRLPADYRAPGSEMPVVQWLDDDHLVLFPNEGGGDFPDRVGDLLECRLPDGVCRVMVHASSTTYRAPG